MNRYHMHGTSVGALNIIRIYGYNMEYQNIEWTKTGDQGNEWHFDQV